MKKISRTSIRRTTRLSTLARPHQRLVHVSAFQYPKTADVFLGLKVRPVGDEDSAIGLRSERLRGPKAASEFPDAVLDTDRNRKNRRPDPINSALRASFFDSSFSFLSDRRRAYYFLLPTCWSTHKLPYRSSITISFPPPPISYVSERNRTPFFFRRLTTAS